MNLSDLKGEPSRFDCRQPATMIVSGFLVALGLLIGLSLIFSGTKNVLAGIVIIVVVLILAVIATFAIINCAITFYDSGVVVKGFRGDLRVYETSQVVSFSYVNPQDVSAIQLGGELSTSLHTSTFKTATNSILGQVVNHNTTRNSFKR